MREDKNSKSNSLPQSAKDFISMIIRKMKYRKKVRDDVSEELTAHFEDHLRECKSDEERQQVAEELISQFGEAKMLGALLRRAKKRCRPLWRTIAARVFQTALVVIVLMIVYVICFFNSKPTIRIDYLQQWNEMSRPQIVDSDNAWPHYEKAINAYVEPNESLEQIVYLNFSDLPGKDLFGDLDENQRQAVKTWVIQNQTAWEHFETAASKPYCYREYYTQQDDTFLLSVLMPHLSPLRNISKMGIWRWRFAENEGKTSQAYDNCLTLIKAGKHWQQRGTLIEQLVGMAITKLGHQELINMLERQEAVSNDLKLLQQSLWSIFGDEFPTVDLDAERLMFLDTVQRVFTDGGIGGGHMIPKNAIPILDVDENEKLLLVAAGSLVHARRNETINMGNQFYNRCYELGMMSPYQRYIEELDSEDIIVKLPEYKYFFVKYFMPALDRILDLKYRSNCLHQAALTIIALQRWKLDKGQYPEGMSLLVEAGYLRELPMDPYSDKPLVYKRTDEGFTLYSVSENFTDDGGVWHVKSDGDIIQWGDTGDAIFWLMIE